MPYSPSGAAESLVHPRQSHRLARLWWIRRTDGFDLRLTDHDHALTFDLFEYTPIGGVDATAIRKAGALEEQNFEARGVISSDAITYDDLRAGRYHEAEVNEYAVDWLYPWAGALQHTRYWITETHFDGEQWTAQVSGIPYWLRFSTGDVLARNCGADLGDARCGVVATDPPYTLTGTVLEVLTGRLSFQAGNLVETDHLYDEGEVVWVTGQNAGIRCVIRDCAFGRAPWTSGAPVITLHMRTPHPIAVGDFATFKQGCDKKRTTCRDKFSNLVNFRGFPHMPGTDKLIQTPTS